MRRFIVVHGKCKLANVVAALHSTSSLTSRLYRRQQKPHKNADDGNHDKEFNKSEGAAWPEFPMRNDRCFHDLKLDIGMTWRNGLILPTAVPGG